jgi:hypothetical protein
MKTMLEQPEPSRSDCHAWGSHPIYHYYASILGIRPASPGFGSVVISPELGSLDWAAGEMVHPAGVITVHVERVGKGLRVKVNMPAGLRGELRLGRDIYALLGAENEITAPNQDN